MKKLKWIVPIASICILGIVLGLILGLQNDKTETKYEKIVPQPTYKLNKPLNLSLDGDILTWDNVQNASGYLVTINNFTFFVSTNQIDLSITNFDNGFVCVKAIGSNEFINSVDSIKIFYCQEVDQEEVAKIKTLLDDFYATLLEEHNILTGEVAEELYLNGLKADDANQLLNLLEDLIKLNFQLPNYQKYDNFDLLINKLWEYLDLNILPYVKVYSSINIMKYYFHHKINNPTDYEKLITTYFTLEQINSNYQYLFNYLDHLDNFEYQCLGSFVKYLSLYKTQIQNIGGLLSTYFKNNDDSTNQPALDLSADINTLKNTLCQVLIDEMPQIIEYNEITEVICHIYQNVSPDYVLNKLSSNDLLLFLRELYNTNHRYISFLSYLKDSEFKLVLKYLFNVLDSLDINSLINDWKNLNPHSLINSLIEAVNNLKQINYSEIFKNSLIIQIKDILSDNLSLASIKELKNLFADLNTKLGTLDLNDYLSIDLSVYNDLLIKDDEEITSSNILRDSLIKELKEKDVLFDEDLTDYQLVIMVIDYLSQNNLPLSSFVDIDIILMEPQYFSKALSFDVLALLDDLMPILVGDDELSALAISDALSPFIDELNEYKEYVLEIRKYVEIYLLIKEINELDTTNIEDMYDIVNKLGILDDESLNNFDYLSLFNLVIIIKTKYAKFDVLYEEQYLDNVVDIDYEDVFLGWSLYLLVGNKALEYEYLIKDSFVIIKDLYEIYNDHVLDRDYVELFDNYQIFIEHLLKIEEDEDNLYQALLALKNIHQLINDKYLYLDNYHLNEKFYELVNSLIAVIALYVDDDLTLYQTINQYGYLVSLILNNYFRNLNNEWESLDDEELYDYSLKLLKYYYLIKEFYALIEIENNQITAHSINQIIEFNRNYYADLIELINDPLMDSFFYNYLAIINIPSMNLDRLVELGECKAIFREILCLYLSSIDYLSEEEYEELWLAFYQQINYLLSGMTNIKLNINKANLFEYLIFYNVLRVAFYRIDQLTERVIYQKNDEYLINHLDEYLLSQHLS